MLRNKSADTNMPVGYMNFEVEGWDIAPGAWRNGFDAKLLKPLVLDNNKKRAGEEKYSQSILQS